MRCVANQTCADGESLQLFQYVSKDSSTLTNMLNWTATGNMMRETERAHPGTFIETNISVEKYYK